MKKQTKRKLGNYALAFGILGGIAFSTTPAFASEDHDYFNYTIKANQANTRTDAPRERTTTDIHNKWMTQVTDSNENGGYTYTTFWLEGYDGTNVSPSMKVLEGDDEYTSDAYSSASKRYVYLTAQNNNDNDDVYTAEGYWDEEGW